MALAIATLYVDKKQKQALMKDNIEISLNMFFKSAQVWVYQMRKLKNTWKYNKQCILVSGTFILKQSHETGLTRCEELESIWIVFGPNRNRDPVKKYIKWWQG